MAFDTAFSKKPNFIEGDNYFPVLFDHTVVSTKIDGTTIRCGNGMALSASKKGLPIDGEDFSKLANFMQSESDVNDENGQPITNGQKYTKQLYEYVDGVRKTAFGEQAVAAPTYDSTEMQAVAAPTYDSTEMQANYLAIEDMKANENQVTLYNEIFGVMCNAMLKEGGGKKWESIIKEIFNKVKGTQMTADEAVETFKDVIKNAKNNPKFNEKGRVDKLYQVFFNNKVWGTQLMGGFQVPSGSPYAPILSETLLDNTRVLKASSQTDNDGLSTAKKRIYSCVPDDGVLFLCESPLFVDPKKLDPKKSGIWEDEEYSGITVKKNEKDGEVYSAIWKKENYIGCKKREDIVCQIVINKKKELIKFPSDQEYAVFEVSGRNVLVIHCSETTIANWKLFLAECKEKCIDYIVGDTNQTKSKNKKLEMKFNAASGKWLQQDAFQDTKWDESKKFEGDIKAFFEEANKSTWELIDSPPKKVGKNRIPLDGFQNNQLNKGVVLDRLSEEDKEKTREKDGMVILKPIQGTANCRVKMRQRVAAYKAVANQRRSIRGKVQDKANPAKYERTYVTGKINGGKRTRKKKKKRTKKGKKARRKKKTRTKSKRKRTRKMRKRRRKK